MGDNMIFKRHELKYLIPLEKKEKILGNLSEYMSIDEYGKSEIRSLYFDTPDYRIIRRSIEKPEYKEKLRIRSYGRVIDEESKVFVELKKKYNSVVYKRRVSMSEASAKEWLMNPEYIHIDNQIGSEIEYFRHFYRNLKPSVLLTYDREAYFMNDGSDFRVTFDDNIQARDEDFSLQSETYGNKLLNEGMVLMELKCSNAMPIWMARTLSGNGIYRTSFSKYGTFYEKYIYPAFYEKHHCYVIGKKSSINLSTGRETLKNEGETIYA